MTFERESEHGRHSPIPPATHDDQTPGRTSTSAQLVAPERPIVSALIRRKARSADGVAAGADAAVAEAAGSDSHSLPAPLLRKFESSLGADLSSVRVHTGSSSQAAAEAVGAKAYTVGHDIHFGAGHYDPSSAAGEHLLAHEVAHTAQQHGGTPSRQHKLEVSAPGDAIEHEADRAADAMVAGSTFSVTSASTSVARKKPDSPPDSHPLTPEDKDHLANATQLLNKAKVNIDKTTSAIDSYAQTAPGLFDQMKSTFDQTKRVYDKNQETVNNCIAKAKAVDAVKKEVIMFALNQAMGPLTDKLSKAMSSTNAAYGALEQAEKAQVTAMRTASAIEALKQFDGALSKATGGGSDKAKGAVQDAAKGAAGMNPSSPPSAAGAPDQVAFLTMLDELRSKGNSLTTLALGLGKVGTAFGSATAFVQSMLDTNKTVPSKPPGLVDKDAAHVWDGSASLAAAAPRVAALAQELLAVAAQTAAAKPQSDKEIEKELWIKWAANLQGKDFSALDLTEIANHCKALGIWDQLGLDPTGWFKSDEQAMAVAMAFAQNEVLAHKGESVEVYALGKQVGTIQLAGLPDLVADLEKAPERGRFDPPQVKTKAVVIGATATKSVDTSILKKTARTKQAVAEYLLKHGYVKVQLRAYADPEAAKPAPEDNAQPDGTSP